MTGVERVVLERKGAVAISALSQYRSRLGRQLKLGHATEHTHRPSVEMKKTPKKGLSHASLTGYPPPVLLD